MNYKQLLEQLETATNESSASGTPQQDALVTAEKKDYSRQHEAANLYGKLQDIEERKRYALNIFIMECVWLLGILAILVVVGLGCLKISDNVLLALIGSTTVNVTTFFLVVTKYLFPNKGEI